MFVTMWQVKSTEELPDGVTPQRKAEVAGGRESRESVTQVDVALGAPPVLWQ